MLGQSPEFPPELGRRLDQPHVADDRLQDHPGDLVPPGAEQLGESLDIVVTQDHRVPRAADRDAGAVRDAVGQGAGPGRDQQGIDVAVVAPGELDDQVPAGEPAGQPDGAHRRLGPAGDEPHQLDRRDRLDDQLGQFALPFGRAP